jgi:hypothetical protein
LPLDKYKANENIYNVFSVDFKKFYKILSPKAAVYCLPGGMSLVSVYPPDSSDSGLDAILYSVSSHAPKSMSLHCRQQKGKNFASSEFSLEDILTIL